MRAPTSAWPKKCTSPSGEIERVCTLPMSWNSASPAHLEARHALAHDLLGVLPHVLVAPLAVAEADHGFDLGQERVERARHEQRVEAVPRELAHHHAVEVRPDVARRQGGEIPGVEQDDGPVGLAALRADNRALERVDRARGVSDGGNGLVRHRILGQKRSLFLFGKPASARTIVTLARARRSLIFRAFVRKCSRGRAKRAQLPASR